MADITRPNGLRIIFPEDYTMVPLVMAPSLGESGIQRLRSGRLPTEAILPEEVAEIVGAMERQAMELVDAIELTPPLESRSGGGRRAVPSAPEAQSISFDIRVEQSEEAVVLVEQDGVYSWVFPSDRTAITQSQLRGTESARSISFRIEVRATEARERRPGQRGLLADLVFSKVKALVFKFTARCIAWKTMEFLERNVSRGIVVIGSEDPERWQRVEDITSVPLPANRPARVLLFIHGTFSNTLGSFGALGGTP